MEHPKQSNTVHVETLNDELCIYDWERKEVHALNPTAGLVWQMCDGQTNPAQIAARLRSELQTELDQTQAEALVWASLEQLYHAHLLEGESPKSSRPPLLTRRQLLKAGVAVALLPVISSIVAPRPVEAQSPGATDIVIFDAGGTYDGNLGGRAGADALCQASANRPAGYTNVRAFLSVDVNDEIRDMPGNYGIPTNLPIVGPNGTQLAPYLPVPLKDGDQLQLGKLLIEVSFGPNRARTTTTETRIAPAVAH